MDVIGRFKPSKQGGWEGRIHTLTIDRKVRLVPNDNRQNDRAPTHIALLGWDRCGEAWEGRSRGDTPRDYLRVQLRDPVRSLLVRAVLFPSEDGGSAELLISDPAADSGHGG